MADGWAGVGPTWGRRWCQLWWSSDWDAVCRYQAQAGDLHATAAAWDLDSQVRSSCVHMHCHLSSKAKPQVGYAPYRYYHRAWLAWLNAAFSHQKFPVSLLRAPKEVP